jgi:hypothetical protein
MINFSMQLNGLLEQLRLLLPTRHIHLHECHSIRLLRALVDISDNDFGSEFDEDLSGSESNARGAASDYDDGIFEGGEVAVADGKEGGFCRAVEDRFVRLGTCDTHIGFS